MLRHSAVNEGADPGGLYVWLSHYSMVMRVLNSSDIPPNTPCTMTAACVMTCAHAKSMTPHRTPTPGDAATCRGLCAPKPNEAPHAQPAAVAGHTARLPTGHRGREGRDGGDRVQPRLPGAHDREARLSRARRHHCLGAPPPPTPSTHAIPALQPHTACVRRSWACRSRCRRRCPRTAARTRASSRRCTTCSSRSRSSTATSSAQRRASASRSRTASPRCSEDKASDSPGGAYVAVRRAAAAATFPPPRTQWMGRAWGAGHGAHDALMYLLLSTAASRERLVAWLTTPVTKIAEAPPAPPPRAAPHPRAAPPRPHPAHRAPPPIRASCR